MRKENSDFQTSFLSEAGSFLQNRDYFAYTALDDFSCWVAVKGLDSDQEVDSAKIAVQAVLESFIAKPSIAKRSLANYMKQAHKVLQQQSLRVRLKASIVVVVSDYRRIRCAIAGNARLYHFRNGVSLFKSPDQSLAQEIFDSQQRVVDTRQHEERDNLLTYLGQPSNFTPYISPKMKLHEGDVLLLSTAGFWKHVEDVEMLDALELGKEPAQYVDILEEVLLSRQRKVVENYTIAAIFINKVYQESNKKKMKYIKWLVASLVTLLLVGGGAAFYQAKQVKKMAELTVDMKEHEKSGNLYFEDGNYSEAVMEYSQGRNVAKKLKDPIHRNLLASKLRITQLIIQGDEAAEAGEFAKAMEHYEKASKEGRPLQSFGKEEIEQRIANMDLIVDIVEEVKKGDTLFNTEDYNAALGSYQKARTKALAISFTGEPQIKAKMEEAEGKIAELTKAQQELRAEGLEKNGDKFYAQQQYSKAIEAYTVAQEIYQETGLIAKVLGLERKIMNSNDKLNPVIPVANTEMPSTEIDDTEQSLEDEMLKEGK
ncbi:serine/threonine protein phosphatase [Metasolibacillus meyeri]|uniref:Serine/threonine protein phosphatase n=1 Tax=Metasolibacillus meyeri TaxID=1071052 RepID=A0AAW9NX95_9BACL|nr:serine/threonine protein phosphatase [Metasolibacillus meyeri]MEC1180046.1 serine/threonine protein phosphatase [Metasolibacillus meyeri]